MEAAQGARVNVKRAIQAILSEMAGSSEDYLNDSLLTEIKSKVAE